MVYWFQEAAEAYPNLYVRLYIFLATYFKGHTLLGYLIYVYGIFPISIFKV